jgi:hypothetical protein
MNNEGEKIIKYLDTRLNYKNIGLYGYSLGGSVACSIANTSKKINFIICDRTFSSLENIVKSRLNYGFVKIILNLFLIGDTANHNYLYNLNNETIHKLIICDYNDEVINMNASIKRGIELKIKNEIISLEIQRIFNKNTEKNIDKIETNLDLNEEYNNNHTDLIRNKHLFTNIEIESFKYDFQIMIKFINQKEDIFVKKVNQDSSSIGEENNESEKKGFNSFFNNKFDLSEINNEKELRLKTILREFFLYFAKESKYFDLINDYLVEMNEKNLEFFINVILFY